MRSSLLDVCFSAHILHPRSTPPCCFTSMVCTLITPSFANLPPLISSRYEKMKRRLLRVEMERRRSEDMRKERERSGGKTMDELRAASSRSRLARAGFRRPPVERRSSIMHIGGVDVSRLGVVLVDPRVQNYSIDHGQCGGCGFSKRVGVFFVPPPSQGDHRTTMLRQTGLVTQLHR